MLRRRGLFMKRLAGLGLTGALLVALPTAATGINNYSAQSGDRLPDGIMRPSSVLGLAGQGPQRIMLFDTRTANLGRGPLEVALVRTGPGGARQLIRNRDGSTRAIQ